MTFQPHSLASTALVLLVALACSGDPAQTLGPDARSLDRSEVADNEKSPRVVPPDHRAFGKTYGQWSAEWWKWAFSLPVPNHPLFDATGAQCAQGQSGPVWFLGGSFTTGSAVRTECEVPAGKAIFFPILNAECSNVEGDGTTQAELLACAKELVDPATNLAVEIDGHSIENLDAFRVQSPAFHFTLPENNFLGAPAGSCIPSGGSCVDNLAVSDGFYLLLRPLSVGAHTIHFHASVPGFTLDIVYELTVAPRRHTDD